MLIKCPECGKEFSDKAPACPGCGCPVEEVKKIIEEAEKATDPAESSVEAQTESQPKAEVKSQTEMQEEQHTEPASDSEEQEKKELIAQAASILNAQANKLLNDQCPEATRNEDSTSNKEDAPNTGRKNKGKAPAGLMVAIFFVLLFIFAQVLKANQEKEAEKRSRATATPYHSYTSSYSGSYGSSSSSSSSSSGFKSDAENIGKTYSTLIGNGTSYMVIDDALWIMSSLDLTSSQYKALRSTTDGKKMIDDLIDGAKEICNTVMETYEELGYTNKHINFEVGSTSGSTLLLVVDGKVKVDASK